MNLKVELVGPHGETVNNTNMTADKLKLVNRVVYIDNVPAFVIGENGQKDPVTPTGWNTYRGNQVMIDNWLEYQLRNANTHSS